MAEQSYVRETLLSAQTTTATGSAFSPPINVAERRFHANGTTSAGVGAATILIEVSEVPNPTTGDWFTLATLSLTLGTVNTSTGTSSTAKWAAVRARISAISGTTATVNCYMGYYK